MTNHINISKIKYHMRDNMRDDNTSIKKLDKKIDKIINEKLSLLVFDFIQNYVQDKKYTDMAYKPITIKLISDITNDNYYDFSIEINNEKINEYNKLDIITKIYNVTALLEYNREFINMINNTFFSKESIAV